MINKLRLTALMLLCSNVAFAEAEFFSDSGIDGPPYAQIFDHMGSLTQQYTGWAITHDYGQTPQGKTLRVIEIQDPRYSSTNNAFRSAVLITGATHGDEYLNIEDRLPEWFLKNRSTSPGVARYLAEGGIIYIVPILNPDGYDSSQRFNARGIDLNRDFDLLPTGDRFFREPETRLLTQWLDQALASSRAQLKLTVDYHCCLGALATPWAYSDDPLPPEASERHLAVAQMMQRTIDANYPVGNSRQTVGYNSKGTSKDYYYAKYNAAAFTFEGTYRDEATRFPQHTQWWDAILGWLSE